MIKNDIKLIYLQIDKKIAYSSKQMLFLAVKLIWRFSPSNFIDKKSHRLDGFARKYPDSRIEVNDDAGSQYSSE
jgi:hypothetical protein